MASVERTPSPQMQRPKCPPAAPKHRRVVTDADERMIATLRRLAVAENRRKRKLDLVFDDCLSADCPIKRLKQHQEIEREVFFAACNNVRAPASEEHKVAAVEQDQ